MHLFSIMFIFVRKTSLFSKTFVLGCTLYLAAIFNCWFYPEFILNLPSPVNMTVNALLLRKCRHTALEKKRGGHKRPPR